MVRRPGTTAVERVQWTVTDPQGCETMVASTILMPHIKPDPGLFTINYDRRL
jgi:hypothetical protein